MNLKEKSFLVFGSGGKLGQAFKLSLENFINVCYFSRDDFDVSDKSQVHKAIIDKKPDVVINAAAYNLVDNCEDPNGLAEAIAVNADAPENMARACNKIGAVFVHFSSDYVFAGNDTNGYWEDSLVKPVNAYGWTKWLGERAIGCSGAKAYIIRTSRLFGPPGISSHGRNSVIDQVKKLALSLDVFDVVDGELACPTYSYDLASTTLEIVGGNKPFGIYHVTNSEPCSRFEFYKAIVQALNIKAKIVPVKAEILSRPAFRSAFSVLKSNKIPPLRNWRIALNELVQKFYTTNN